VHRLLTRAEVASEGVALSPTPQERKVPRVPVLAACGRVADATRCGAARDVCRARQDLAVARLERAIHETINAAPPLTPQCRAQLAVRLEGGRTR
jgi:hypothetical protein